VRKNFIGYGFYNGIIMKFERGLFEVLWHGGSRTHMKRGAVLMYVERGDLLGVQGPGRRDAPQPTGHAVAERALRQRQCGDSPNYAESSAEDVSDSAASVSSAESSSSDTGDEVQSEGGQQQQQQQLHVMATGQSRAFGGSSSSRSNELEGPFAPANACPLIAAGSGSFQQMLKAHLERDPLISTARAQFDASMAEIEARFQLSNKKTAQKQKRRKQRNEAFRILANELNGVIARETLWNFVVRPEFAASKEHMTGVHMEFVAAQVFERTEVGDFVSIGTCSMVLRVGIVTGKRAATAAELKGIMKVDQSAHKWSYVLFVSHLVHGSQGLYQTMQTQRVDKSGRVAAGTDLTVNNYMSATINGLLEMVVVAEVIGGDAAKQQKRDVSLVLAAGWKEGGGNFTGAGVPPRRPHVNRGNKRKKSRNLSQPEKRAKAEASFKKAEEKLEKAKRVLAKARQ
jgi:hypothetical protein